MNTPKNIKDWLARSVIVRNHHRDEEMQELRAWSKEFQCHECKLQFTRGEIFSGDTSICNKCCFIFCTDCFGDEYHGHCLQCIINHTLVKRR